nr:oligosaccharide flippase family protein [uncultured Rhodoferax sp.]
MSRTVVRNASFSAAQTVVSAFLLFFLYRYLLQTLGSEQLGIWAVVLASTSMARLSDMGLSGAALRFVAKNLADGKTAEAADTVETASVSIGVVLAVLLMLAYPALKLILASVIPENSMPQAISILPWAMLSLWFGLLAGIFQSALDGCGRMDLRNIILIACNVMYLAGALWLVPNYGLEGLAKGQFAQSFALVVLSWITLRKQLPSLSQLPCVWKRSVFKEMFSYALNFQVSGMAAMLFDPTIKFFITKFGGLSDVAFYEMANQVVLKVRGILISAFQAIVPTIASVKQVEQDRLKALYRKSYGILSFIAVPYFVGLTVALPLISILWIGHLESKFLTFGIILSLGWMLTNIGVPAFFYNIGTGQLGWNTASQFCSTGLLIPLALCSGIYYGSFAIVTSAMFAAAAANLGLAVIVQYRMKVPVRELMPVAHTFSYLSVAVAVAVVYSIKYITGPYFNNILLSLTELIIYVFIISWSIWVHPYRKLMVKQILSRSKND